MDKTLKITIFLLCLLAGLSVIEFSLFTKQPDTGIICFVESCFRVEIAKTELQKERGLMNRNNLDKDKGMLFVFDQEENYPFWMKNTLIPLDIIWINQNNEVVFIAENTQPCGISDCPNIDPQQNAKYVLELNGGLTKELNLKVGDKAELNY